MKNLQTQQRRTIQTIEGLLDKHITKATNKLKKKYRAFSTGIINEVNSLLNSINRQQDKTLSNYNNYHLYQRCLARIDKDCLSIAKLEKSLIEDELVELYIVLYEEEPFADKTDKNTAESSVNKVWVADKKSWQDRVDEHTEKLFSRLDSIITTSATLNRGTDETELLIKKAIDVSFSESDTLVDTEFSHTMNVVLEDKYKDNNVKYAQFVCFHDNRTCAECLARDGQIFKVGDPAYKIPVHPRCRCCSIPKTNN